MKTNKVEVEIEIEAEIEKYFKTLPFFRKICQY